MKHNFSALPSFPPDPAVYPLFAQAAYATCVLKPGDALYIPRLWWHWVTSFERNIAINFWHTDVSAGETTADRSAFRDIGSITDTTGFAETYFARKAPVVVRSGEIARWPAFSRWTDEYLLERGQGRVYPVGVSPDAQLCPVEGDHRTRGEVLTLADMLERARTSDERYYLAQNKDLPRLCAGDWEVPSFWRDCFDDQQFQVRMWLTPAGERGVTSALHFDAYENLIVQVSGWKRVILFAPSQTPFVYRQSAESLRPWTDARPSPLTAPAPNVEAGSDRSRAIELDSRLRRHAASCTVTVDARQATIQFAENSISGHPALEAPFRFIAGTSAFTVRDVPGRLTDGAKLMLLRRLVDEGLLDVVPEVTSV